MRERPKIPFRDTLCFYFHGTLLNDRKLAACFCISVEGTNRGKAGKPMGKGQVFPITCCISTMSGSVVDLFGSYGEVLLSPVVDKETGLAQVSYLPELFRKPTLK